MNRFIILLLTLGILQSTLNAQNEPPITVKDDYKPTNRAETGWFVTLAGGPYFSSSSFEMSNALIDIHGVNDIFFKSDLSYHFQGEISYFFTENLGFGIGGGYSTYHLSIGISEMDQFVDNVLNSDGILVHRVFSGEGIEESIDFSSIHIHLGIHYKQSISEYLFIYGNLNGGFASFSNNSFTRSASSIIYKVQLLNDSNSVLEGFIPRNSAEADFLEKNQLFNESQSNSVQVEDVNAVSTGLVAGANLGIMASLNEKLRIKLGGVFRLSDNILNESIEPSDPLIKVEPSNNNQVENIYVPLLNRQGNQIKLSSIGIEIGFMYKL